MSEGVPAMWMRGGGSKGGYFLASDLPADAGARDRLLLRLMGSPHPLQIDGLGGGHPLTSKVAVVRPSTRPDADVDYLFLQVGVTEGLVTDAQNCGNILAGVGPFAIERGLVAAGDPETVVRIFMQNTGQLARARVQTPRGRVRYDGDVQIDGVPGSAAGILLEFADSAGSKCGKLLPTGRVRDEVHGLGVTLIDNGMPCVVIAADELGVAGTESCAELEANVDLRRRIETLRLAVGPMMNLGDVTHLSIPKLMIVSAPTQGGAIGVRSFIPHRCHESIGVLGAVTVATACLLEGTPAHAVAQVPVRRGRLTISVEHPSGQTPCQVEVGPDGDVVAAGMLRTARKLADGRVFA